MTSKRTVEDMAAWVKSIRLALGLSQEDFAKEVGVVFSTVNRWERGRSTPLPVIVRRLKELEKKAKR